MTSSAFLRRAVTSGLFIALAATASPGVGAAADDPPPVDAFRFVSMPDFLNADIGDVAGSPYYRPGQPNSTNASYETAISTILDAVQAEGTPHLLIAGDFVEGHWGVDTAKTRTFGPLWTEVQKIAAVNLAADTYYRQNLARFTARGLILYPAVGDHEIGDNPWRRSAGGVEAFKWRNMSVFKNAFARTMLKEANGTPRFGSRPDGQASGTAYAVRPHPEVQLISLDVFRRTTSDIVPEIDYKQMAWLKGVLAAARADGVDWIVVQGHTPIVGPVRKQFSSALMYQGGQTSALWKVLKDNGVDLYLNGEFHDITAHHVDGIAQITHGGLIQQGGVNYLVVDVTPGTMTLTVKRFAATSDWTVQPLLWQTDTTKAKASVVSVEPVPQTVGTMVIDRDLGLIERTGLLEEYLG